MVWDSHPVIVAVFGVVLALLLARWLAPRFPGSRQHGNIMKQLEPSRGTAHTGTLDIPEDGVLSQIAALMDEETELIRQIVRERLAGDHVPPEQTEALRSIHRNGLALRRQCADPTLDAEFG